MAGLKVPIVTIMIGEGGRDDSHLLALSSFLSFYLSFYLSIYLIFYLIFYLSFFLSFSILRCNFQAPFLSSSKHLFYSHFPLIRVGSGGALGIGMGNIIGVRSTLKAQCCSLLILILTTALASSSSFPRTFHRYLSFQRCFQGATSE